MRFRFAITALLLSVTTAQAQHRTGHAKAPPATRQFGGLAARTANQALDMTAVPSALPPQPIVPGADAIGPGLSTPGLYDNPATANAPEVGSQPYDPGSIHYPYGRASIGTIDPASHANPYGPYSAAPDSAYGHYSGPALPQTPNTLFGNPAPAFGFTTPSFGTNNTPAFSRGR